MSRDLTLAAILLVVMVILGGLSYYEFTTLNSKVSREQTELTSLEVKATVDSGINYLLANYNQTIGLIRNSPDSTSLQNTYYLYSDNYLATVALWNYAPGDPLIVEVVQNISKTMRSYLSTMKTAVNQYEALTTNICAFNGSKDFLVKTLEGASIWTTVNNQSSSWLSASNYSDIAFLEAICYSRLLSTIPQATTPAQIAYKAGVSNLKGLCFEDEPFTNPKSGSYDECQTYKLALYIYVSKLLNEPYPQSALNLLLNMSAPSGIDNGGFYTCYGTNLQPMCGTNVETTALAILALLPVPATNPPVYEPPI